MKLFISGIDTVAAIQDAAGVTKTLSILEFDPSEAYSKTSNSVNTWINVHDHETRINDHSPSLVTVAKILDFCSKIQDDDVVLVHCFAGISRSTAAALIIAYEKTGDLDKAAEVVKAIRPQAAPNRLIASLADAMYQFDDERFYLKAEEMNVRRGYVDYTNNKLLPLDNNNDMKDNDGASS